MSDEPSKTLYFNDEAALDGSFGIAPAGDRVAKIVLDVDTPFTLGVTGKWGAGKTSVLRRAFASLGGGQMQVEVPFWKPRKEGNEKAWNQLGFDQAGRKTALQFDAPHVERAQRSLAVWFSPWQHQVAANPMLPLLLEIKKQFSWKVRTLGVTSKSLRRGALAGLTLLERLIDGALVLHGGDGIATGTTDAVRKAWQESGDGLENFDDGQRFQLLFQDAIETALDGLKTGRAKGEKGRLIVFVDDLDRCEESVVVKLREAIKLYLGSPRCVFVLGIDEVAVAVTLLDPSELAHTGPRTIRQSLVGYVPCHGRCRSGVRASPTSFSFSFSFSRRERSALQSRERAPAIPGPKTNPSATCRWSTPVAS